MHKRIFFRQLSIECKKAVRNKMFFITFFVASVFASMSALYNIGRYYEFESIDGNPMTQIVSLYNSWIGGDYSSLGSICFFYLLPLLAAFPYGWGYLEEHKSGYVKNMVIRGGKTEYFICKYIAVFIAGGLVILVPLILNYLTVAMFVPAYQPEAHYSMYLGISYGTMWSHLFYTYPVLYDILYILMDFVFAGLFACMSLAVSMVVKNKIAVLLLPYFMILTLHYSRVFAYYHFYQELSPLNYLSAVVDENNTCWWIVLLEGGFVFIITITMVMGIGRKRELI